MGTRERLSLRFITSLRRPARCFPTTKRGQIGGNVLKTTKELASYDADSRAALDHLAQRPDCTGQLGAMGICIGGHLAYRAALNPDVRAAVCFYATDMHKRSLGKGMSDDSLLRAGDIRGELLMIWGNCRTHIFRWRGGWPCWRG